MPLFLTRIRQIWLISIKNKDKMALKLIDIVEVRGHLTMEVVGIRMSFSGKQLTMVVLGLNVMCTIQLTMVVVGLK